MTKNCNCCWFFCHTDGRCYVDPRSAFDEDYALKNVMAQPCSDWAFDGIQQWERDELEKSIASER